MKVLNVISIAAYKCMDDWVKGWYLCIDSDGDYFEGGKRNLDEEWILYVLFINCGYIFDTVVS